MLPSVAGVQSVLVAESAFSSNERATSLLSAPLSSLRRHCKPPLEHLAQGPTILAERSARAQAGGGAVVASSGLHCDFRDTTLQISEATGPSNHLGAACLRLFFFFNKSAFEEVSCHSLLLEWLLQGFDINAKNSGESRGNCANCIEDRSACGR